MKQSADTTLFAWEHWGLDDQTRSCLLAPSPLAFMQRNIVYTPPPRCTEVQARPNHNVSISRLLVWGTAIVIEQSPQAGLVPLVVHRSRQRARRQRRHDVLHYPRRHLSSYPHHRVRRRDIRGPLLVRCRLGTLAVRRRLGVLVIRRRRVRALVARGGLQILVANGRFRPLVVSAGRAPAPPAAPPRTRPRVEPSTALLIPPVIPGVLLAHRAYRAPHDSRAIHDQRPGSVCVVADGAHQAPPVAAPAPGTVPGRQLEHDVHPRHADAALRGRGVPLRRGAHPAVPARVPGGPRRGAECAGCT